MKRVDQLTPLSKDHHQSLVLANRCKKLAIATDESAKCALREQIVAEFPGRWERHFEIEEITLFLLGKRYPDQLGALIIELEQEHAQLRALYRKLKDGDNSQLSAFGELLGSHTRKEERQLFELVQDVFSEQELNAVYDESVRTV
jgi:hemerythrin-like domain-containing protein